MVNLELGLRTATRFMTVAKHWRAGGSREALGRFAAKVPESGSRSTKS
jgi:hypothetical protein